MSSGQCSATVRQNDAHDMFPREDACPGECPVAPASISIAEIVSTLYPHYQNDAHGMFPREDACPGECPLVPASSSIARISRIRNI